MTDDLDKLPDVATSGGNMTFTFVGNDAGWAGGDTTVAIEVGTTLAAWSSSYPLSVQCHRAAIRRGRFLQPVRAWHLRGVSCRQNQGRPGRNASRFLQVMDPMAHDAEAGMTGLSCWEPAPRQSHAPQARRLAARDGYTLVEVLVTIALVAVLAVIAFTTTRSAVRAAKSAKAMSNLRQIGVLVVSYATENNNRIPFYMDWGRYSGNPPGLVFFQRTLAEYAGYAYAQSPQNATRPLPDFFYDPCLEGDPFPQHPMGTFGVNAAILPDADECRSRFGSKQGMPMTAISDPAGKVICCSVVEPNWSSGWAFDGKFFAKMAMIRKADHSPATAAVPLLCLRTDTWKNST